MNYSDIKYYDIANGPGVRTSVFVSGCKHHCKFCFNAEAWSFDGGKSFTESTIDDILSSMSSKYIDGLSILGGEPLEPENQKTVLDLVNRAKIKNPDKDIWLWTGFIWNDILNNPSCRAYTPIVMSILQKIDVLVDGPFENDKKDLLLRFRGSSNQRIINVKESLMGDSIVLWKDNDIYETHTW